MEIRRFGIGYRRSEGPPGTRGVQATPIHGDRLGVLAELALRPNASVPLHSNANLTYLVVIEGGGFVQVGDEKARVAAGEAVVWPPNVDHAVWTETTPLRAIVVEFPLDASDAEIAVVEGVAVSGEDDAGGVGPTAAGPAEGGIVEDPGRPEDHRSTEGEPW
jgi:quercetin dioxygenase-like cupin family protein